MKRLLISNNNSKEQEIIIKELLNKATLGSNKSLCFFIFEENYYNAVVDTIIDSKTSYMNKIYKYKKTTKIELLNGSVIEVYLFDNMSNFQNLRGKKINELYIKLNNESASEMNKDNNLYSLLSAFTSKENDTLTIAINNKIDIDNDLIITHRKILI